MMKDLESPPTAAFGDFALSGLSDWWLRQCQKVVDRRKNRWLRRPLKWALRGWVDTCCWGLRLRLASSGNVSEQRLLYWPDGIDRLERHAISESLSSGGTFLDIGANAGLYSLWVAAMQRDDVRVEAFEPDAGLCERLKANLRRNSIRNVRLHECALGEADGLGALIRNGTNLGCNYVTAAGNAEKPIRVRRLPKVLRALGVTQIKALKIDVEGTEENVLRPLFEDVSRDLWPSLVICEMERRYSSTPAAELLQTVGYELQQRTRMNGIFRLSRSSDNSAASQPITENAPAARTIVSC